MKKLLSFIIICSSCLTMNAQTITINPILPGDGDTIPTKLPCISWATNGVFNFNDNRTFLKLIVVKLDKGQSAQAGIAVNTPLVKMEHLNANQVFYPFDAPELVMGGRYGWQVQAISNGIVIGSSEAWEFTLQEKKPVYTKYATLKLYSDGSEYLADGGKVFFILNEKYKSNQLKVSIIDENKQIVKTSAEKEAVDGEKEGLNVISLGNNYYELNVGSFCKPGKYQLQVTNAKKQKYILDFIVR
jgi:hypothetical protein